MFRSYREVKEGLVSALARAHRGSFEKINEPFLFRDGASPAEYGAGLKLAIERGWLTLHESGTFVTFTPVGAEMFA